MSATYTRLSSSFGGHQSIAAGRDPIGEDALRRMVPSVFAAEAHESRSDKYAYIPTIEVLRGLRQEGFEVYSAIQGKCRLPGKIGRASCRERVSSPV